MMKAVPTIPDSRAFFSLLFSCRGVEVHGGFWSVFELASGVYFRYGVL